MRKNKHVQHTGSEEPACSLWDSRFHCDRNETRHGGLFSPMGGGGCGGRERNAKETNTKSCNCPTAQDDSTRENSCKLIFRDG